MILAFRKKDVKKLMKKLKVENMDLIRTADLIHSNLKRLEFKTAFIFVGWINITSMKVKTLYFRHSDKKEYEKILHRGY